MGTMEHAEGNLLESRRHPSTHLSSQDQSAESSRDSSRQGSVAGGDARPPKERPRVRFNSNANDRPFKRRQHSSFGRLEGSKPLPSARVHNDAIPQGSMQWSPYQGVTDASTDIAESLARSPIRPAIRSPLRSPARSPVRSPARSSTPSPRSSRARSPVGPSAKRVMGKFSLVSDNSELDDVAEEIQSDGGETRDMDEKTASQYTAHLRAQSLSRSLRGLGSRKVRSFPGSIAGSPPVSPPDSPTYAMEEPLDLTNIPLEKLTSRREKYAIDDSDSDDEQTGKKLGPRPKRFKTRASERSNKGVEPKSRNLTRERGERGNEKAGHEESGAETRGLKSSNGKVRRFRKAVRDLVFSHHGPIDSDSFFKVPAMDSGLQSGQVTPVSNSSNSEQLSRQEYRKGVLGGLMGLYHENDARPGGSESLEQLIRSAPTSPTESGTSTPRKLPKLHKDHSTIRGTPPSPTASGASTPRPSESGTSTPKRPPKWYIDDSNNTSTTSLTSLFKSPRNSPPSGPRPSFKRSTGKQVDKVVNMAKRHRHNGEVIHIRDHIEEQIERYNYLVKLCKALMLYGAPTHRLEEYMRTSASVLDIHGKFLFVPGCMLISFEDPSTLTSDVRIVRSDHSVDLGKLQDMYEIYKAVTHDKIGAREGTERLDELSRTKQRFGPWTVVLFYGLASACVGPFAFDARLIDLPVAFFLGCLLGVMKIILSPKSDLYANVFEVTAAVITSFLARAFGSIQGGNLFCFSALAQSSIALILPGYIVLCGALELQSRNIVAGSVRMVYAVIYSLFLGFGITIGTSFYGGIDKGATSEVTCRNPLPGWWNFIFVPSFTFCLIVINQGKYKQVPVMLVVSLAGYTVNPFSALKFASNVQVAQTLGALTIGILGNLYSRFFHGLSAAALLPAIFVQVPSGLAASGSLITGLTSANEIINGTTNGTTTVSNGTQAGSSGIDVNSTVFNIGYSMIQVAIGITVGLFLSSLLIYPFGKRRSGLFSF